MLHLIILLMNEGNYSCLMLKKKTFITIYGTLRVFDTFIIVKYIIIPAEFVF